MTGRVVRRGEVWHIPTVGRERTVLVVSVEGIAEGYGIVVAVPLHDPEVFRESLTTVRVTEPVTALAGVIDIASFRASRFTEGGKLLGVVDRETMERVELALRAVLGL